MRGTLLNTVTVAVGATVGALVGKAIPEAYKDVALHGLGLVTVGIGLKMFLQGRNPLVTAIAVAVGGILGLAIGIQAGIVALGDWAKYHVGAGGATEFTHGLLASFVLFCVGPVTLLGCLEDGLEGKIELLSIKSTLDGIAAVFLAATMGWGVLLTAGLLLVFQGLLTLLAKPLRPFGKDEEIMAATSAAGGAIMLATGIGLLGISDLHPAHYLPAVFLAPIVVAIGRRFPKRATVAA